MVRNMCHRNKKKNVSDEGNLSTMNTTQNNSQQGNAAKENVEPLPESSRPRKDGPGGE